jgi:hypothetical protein
MKRKTAILLAMMGALLPAAAEAQTHVVKKPETVVRAIAVYEWTGDEAKPTASRLVPVSIFINNELRDAGLYLARPVPFALDRGNIFEGQKAGVPEGTLELAFQRHLQAASDTPFDDRWTAYGIFKPVPKETAYIAPKQTRPISQVVVSGGTRPQFSNRSDTAGTSTTASSDDPNKPKMQRRDDSSTGESTASSNDSNKPVLQKRSDSTDTTTPDDTKAASSAPADDDPHRPVLTRRSDSGNSTEQTSATTSPSSTDSTDEADRPTLKKRTPAQSKAAQKKGDQASVTSAGSLNDDPDRPTLHRGTSSSPDIPPLNGLPADMHQMVAVSDARNRPVHDFARPWDSDVEQAEVLARMEQTARAKLAAYDMQTPPPAAPAPPPAKTTAAARTKKPAPVAPPPPAPAALADESLHGYTLSYGGAATFVYTASSPGMKGATRYVSIVAQQEPLGELKVALASVTDSTHLDRTPWLRLVDVVDAEASNRASLLFELRDQNARQFALYRVIGAQADQIFSTGTTP